MSRSGLTKIHLDIKEVSLGNAVIQTSTTRQYEDILEKLSSQVVKTERVEQQQKEIAGQLQQVIITRRRQDSVESLPPPYPVNEKNTIPYASETYQSCLNGDIVSLKKRFENGLASPYDVDPDGVSMVHHALSWNQFRMVALLVSYGADLYQEDHTGLSAFHYAWDSILTDPTDNARKRQLLELFPQEEGGLDERQFTRLHKCVLQLIGTEIATELEISTALIDIQDNVGRTPLYWAARRGNTRAVKLLLEYGANPSLSSAKTNWKNPLHAAAIGGHEACLAALLATGMPIDIKDAEGMTAFHYAASKPSDTSCVALMLDHGANIHEVDTEDRTAFLMATQNGNLNVAALLHDRGADVNTLEISGWNALLSCVFWNMRESIEFCFDVGVDVSCVTKEGDSLLHIAAQYADIETVQLLMDRKLRGLDTQALNNAEQSPRDIALSRKEESTWNVSFEAFLCSLEARNNAEYVVGENHVTKVDKHDMIEPRSVIIDVVELDDGASDENDVFEDALESVLATS